MYGGRWNPPGLAVAYAASSRALAILEYLAHIDRELVPDDLALFGALLPDDAIEDLATRYPADWNCIPVPASMQQLGRSWIEAGTSLAATVPSVLVPHETNVIIAPAHPRFREMRFERPEALRLDIRLLSYDTNGDAQ